MISLRSIICLIALVSRAAAAGPTPRFGYKVIKVYPHDPTSYTQGLEYRGGFLYEGTGLNGHSVLRKVDLTTGKPVQEIRIGPQYFGEGITVMAQKIVQLTWQSHLGFVYDQLSFRQLRTFEYPGEGWGLTNDGKRIYMSDGSSHIRIWNPDNLEEQKRLTVRDGTKEIDNLNELEYVRGQILAN